MKELFFNKIKNVFVLSFLIFTTLFWGQKTSVKLNFNHDWKFTKITGTTTADKDLVQANFDDSNWEKVSLPHTANIEPLVVNNQWQGICWYRKSFDVEASAKGKKIFLEFEGAMNIATVWINGQEVAHQQGGYLPILIDATQFLKTGNNTIALKLDNTDNAVTGPKPLKILDFNMYGGLYRNAFITYKEKIYISHPLLAKKMAGGGVFVNFSKVSKEAAVVDAKTHLVNETTASQKIELVESIFFKEKLITQTKTQNIILGKNELEIKSSFNLKNPNLWSPETPNLYQLETKVLVDGKLMDKETTTFGIRLLEFKGTDLYVNGLKTYLRGVNRHQEYPFIGYALSDNAQYRDAKKIKDAGFNCIRLSHYPQSPAFLDACDQLGLFVVDAILGWQYYAENEGFKNFCYESATNLVRRDRNHASVLSWEVSLNETKMPISFMEELDKRVHQEYPGSQAFSCGWMPEVYDIYFQARQHRIMHGNENHESKPKPYFVSEYGDWEYYSTNAGLNQDKMPKGLRIEKSSRHYRKEGEKALLQQAYNLQESYNDNLNTAAFGDGYWVMFDYNRGYHDDIETSGIMDIFRLPKFGFNFYESQKSVEEAVVLKIASYWNEQSDLNVKIFSNCDQVELFLNGKSLGKQNPDSDKNTTKLPHPPFSFKLKAFEAGQLKAVGFINGKAIKTEFVNSPQKVEKLKVWVDQSGKNPQAGVNDAVFVYIAAVDKNGTIVPDFDATIDLNIIGDAQLMNLGVLKAEAGIATALIKIGDKKGKICIKALANNIIKGDLSFKTHK